MARRNVGLPVRPFLWTLDQISAMVMVDVTRLKQQYIYFEGRSTGVPRADLLRCHNIAEATDKPDWRVADNELTRWMHKKGFKPYV